MALHKSYDLLYQKFSNGTGTSISVGDIVSYDIDNPNLNRVIFPDQEGRAFVVGPAIKNSSSISHPVYVSRVGKHVVKVDNSNGNINIGDILMVKGDGTPVCVKYDDSSSYAIGVAVESYSSSLQGLILADISCLSFKGTTSILQSNNTQGISSNILSMSLGGEYDKVELPLTNIGLEFVSGSPTLVKFSGRRIVAGISGTTSIQLEINGNPISGAVLSWSYNESNFTFKQVYINEVVQNGDRVSFRLLGAELGAKDIFAEVSTS